MRTVLGVNAIGALCMVALVSALTVAPESPVADAAMRGDAEAVRALLKQGADVNAAHGDGMTALHWAAERGDAEIAQMLVQAGANVQAVTRIGQYTALHLASRTGSAAVATLLLESGADVNAKTTNSGATALHLAAASGAGDVVAALIDHGADLNARESEWEQTPLIFAAAQNRPDAIRVLLARGANAELTSKVVDIAAQTALAAAADRRKVEVLAAFGVKSAPARRQGEADPPELLVSPSQVRAAALAAREVLRTGKVEGAQAQGGRRAEPDPTDDATLITGMGGLTPLLHAARQGHVEAAIALLDGGAAIDQGSANDGTTPLLMAAINGQFDLAQVLIRRGADVNRASALNGTTPLWATVNSYWQSRNFEWPTPQEHSRQNATYLEVMEALLQAGADPNARTTKHPWYMDRRDLEEVNGATAFWRAAYATDVDAMRLLVSYGADPNIATIKPPDGLRRRTGDDDAKRIDPSGLPPIPPGGPGVYPIHAASGVGYAEGYAGNFHRHVPEGWIPSLKYLIEELGVDVDTRDHNGYTALHHAAARGDNDLILYLVSQGADIMVVSRQGQTTADMANGPFQRISPFPAIVALLESLGSKNNHNCVSC